jgi:hypothetical protein
MHGYKVRMDVHHESSRDPKVLDHPLCQICRRCGIPFQPLGVDGYAHLIVNSQSDLDTLASFSAEPLRVIRFSRDGPFQIELR